MECDDVMLLVAMAGGRTLSGVEERDLQSHIAGCEGCRALEAEHRIEAALQLDDDRQHWVARIPSDALDDRDLLVLPTVNPIVFEMAAELGQGGMGRISRAHDRRLGRDVAIKEMLDPSLRARFEREAMITARLQHPAIVPIYEAGNWPDGSAFYTMRLVAGGTLADAIARTRTLEDRLALLPHVVALTEALGYAHSRRVVHRDLKPANVLVGEFGETVVIDWGLAKELDRGDGDAGSSDGATSALLLTRAGAVVGTPCFMAPEQAAGKDIDERADVYALGSILYNLLVGDPPYWDSVEHSVEQLLAASRSQDATPIEQLVPRVPADLRVIVERAMARDKAARYATAREMAEELRRFETGQLLRSREYRMRDLVLRRLRKHRAAVTVGAIALAVLAIVGAVSVRKIVTREHETRRALAESQIERGRQSIIDGDPDRAAGYLAVGLAELPGDEIGRRLATITLRDAHRWLRSFPGTTAAFRDDGQELAIGRANGMIDLVDPGTAKLARTLTLPDGKEGKVAALAYEPHGTRLAVASSVGAYLCDPGTAACRELLPGVDASEVVVLPGGDRLAILNKRAHQPLSSVTIVGFDGTVLRSDDDLDRPIGLAVSPDRGYLSAVVDNGAIAWREADLQRVARAKGFWGWRFAAMYDHGDLITAGVDGVRRWTPKWGYVMQWWWGHIADLVNEPSVTLSWINDRTLLADGKIIHADTGEIHAFARSGVQAAALIDPTHAITGGYDHTLRIWDLERDARPVAVLDTRAAIDLLIADPTGRYAASRLRSTDDGTWIELWDVTRIPAPVRTGSAGAKIYALASDHGDHIAVQWNDGIENLTTLMTKELKAIKKIKGWFVGFGPRSHELVTGNWPGVISIYAIHNDTVELPRELGNKSDPVWQVVFSSDGELIATCSDRRVTIRNAEWQVITSFEIKAGKVSALALDDRGFVVTGHEDGRFQVWNWVGGQLGPPVTAHTAKITGIQVRGDTIATVSWDGVTRLWAVPSGKPRGSFNNFWGTAISPTGQRIATVDGSPVVSVSDGMQNRVLEQIPTLEGLTHVAFIDDNQVVVGGASGHLEIVALSEPLLTADQVQQFVKNSRWKMVDGQLAERTEAAHPPGGQSGEQAAKSGEDLRK